MHIAFDYVPLSILRPGSDPDLAIGLLQAANERLAVSWVGRNPTAQEHCAVTALITHRCVRDVNLSVAIVALHETMGPHALGHACRSVVPHNDHCLGSTAAALDWFDRAIAHIKTAYASKEGV